MSLDNTKREYQRLATVEVVGFMKLQVHPKVTGREMLQELLKVIRKASQRFQTASASSQGRLPH